MFTISRLKPSLPNQQRSFNGIMGDCFTVCKSFGNKIDQDKTNQYANPDYRQFGLIDK